MSVEIKSGVAADLLTIDATSKAARVTLYDTSGNTLMPAGGAAITADVGGQLISGRDYKLARTLRTTRDGSLAVASTLDLMFYDSFEGATVDLANKWVHTLTTMTITQAAATGVLLNASAITTINTGAMANTQRAFALVAGSPIKFTAQVRIGTPTVSNWVGEWGFQTPPATAITVAVPDGAFFRRVSGGTIECVIASNGSEITQTTGFTPGATDDITYEVIWEDDRATFIMTQKNGTAATPVVTMEWTATLRKRAAVTHVRGHTRLYNLGSAPASAPVVNILAVSIHRLDSTADKSLNVQQALTGYDGLTVPTTYAQAAQSTNSADPAAAVLSNVTPSYTSLGGKWIGPTPTPAAAVTDFILFGYTVQAPYTFVCTGVTIWAINRGVAIATTATVIEWSMGFNASAASLATAAPGDPKRIFIGAQQWAIGAGVDAPPSPEARLVVMFEGAPKVTQPGRVLSVILRVVQGTATASGFLRGHVGIHGYFI